MNTSTASIYILAINENFPVAGQRNDSQGFRNNFRDIQSALKTINTSIDELSTLTVKHFIDNDINGYNFINVNLEHGNISAALPGYGTSIIDYSRANYWPITLLNSGNHSLSIQNMPSNTGTGVLTVSISTTTADTTVTFISDEATVISLGPEDQPFNLGSSTPYFFKLWNDYTGDIPYIYVKKISQDIIYPKLNATVSSDTLLGDTASFNTLTLGILTYTVNNLKNVVVSGINQTSTATGNIGLVPRITQAVVTGTLVGIAGGTAYSIGVTDTTGVYPGDRVRFAGTTSYYTVANTVGTLVNLTGPFDIGYTNVGDTVTFIGNQFPQPTVMTMSDIASIDYYGSVSTGSAYNLKGTVYADQNTLQVTYADPNGTDLNTVEFKVSTTITNTSSNDIVTVGIAHQWLPAGSIIMWSKSRTKIPYGWWLCDGSIAPNGTTVPDLRNQFVVGADSELNGVPTVTDYRNHQITQGGSTQGVLQSHTHLGTATTFAVHDPGHHHLAVGPNTTSPFPDPTNNVEGPYDPSPQEKIYWGFTSEATAIAAQWLTSPEYTFSDKQGHTPSQGTGIELETRITVDSTGTTSAYSNLPQYRSLYFIYKWLTA